MRDESHQNKGLLQKYFELIHLQLYFLDFFFLHQLECPIFKKFDQTKIFQILLYTLSNLFDSTNLTKLICPCISGDL